MLHIIISCPTRLTLCPRTYIIKGNANIGRNPPCCSFSDLMTPFPAIAFINEEATGCINEEVIGAINEAAIGTTIASRNLPF